MRFSKLYILYNTVYHQCRRTEVNNYTDTFFTNICVESKNFAKTVYMYVYNKPVHLGPRLTLPKRRDLKYRDIVTLTDVFKLEQLKLSL